MAQSSVCLAMRLLRLGVGMGGRNKSSLYSSPFIFYKCLNGRSLVVVGTHRILRGRANHFSEATPNSLDQTHLCTLYSRAYGGAIWHVRPISIWNMVSCGSNLSSAS